MDAWMGWGAFSFGLILGWYVYYVNRYRKTDVQFSDITTIVAAIGGGALTKLFTAGSTAELGIQVFGVYAIGLAVGFFGYFLVLIVLVSKSKNFTSDWFLDGRRTNPGPNEGYGKDAAGTVHPMLAPTQQVIIHAPVDTRSVTALRVSVSDINANAQRVIDACVAAWPSKKDACNFFAIEVASRLGLNLTGRADDIVDQIGGTGWTQLADGPAASNAANAGKFVIAAMKSTQFTPPRQEGHVAVVVVGAMNPGGWAPAGYWGSTDSDIASKGGAGNPISQCFRQSDSGAITYACRDF